MSKVIPAVFKPSEHEQIDKLVTENCFSYILITCTQPTKEGKMKVEMSCKGDHDLLGLLIQHGSARLE